MHEFVYTVKKTEEKLRHLSSTTNVTVILPQISTGTPELIAKSQYLRESVENIECIKKVCLQDIEYDESDHPTVSGTGDILKQIHAANNN